MLMHFDEVEDITLYVTKHTHTQMRKAV